MANQGELLPNRAVVQAQAGHRDHQQYHVFDAARGLMLLGAAAAVSSSTVSVCKSNPDTACVFFLAFVTWLLGVCLLSLVPVAGRFPEADRLAGAAIISTAPSPSSGASSSHGTSFIMLCEWAVSRRW